MVVHKLILKLRIPNPNVVTFEHTTGLGNQQGVDGSSYDAVCQSETDANGYYGDPQRRQQHKIEKKMFTILHKAPIKYASTTSPSPISHFSPLPAGILNNAFAPHMLSIRLLLCIPVPVAFIVVGDDVASICKCAR